jgi:hypothetical protein
MHREWILLWALGTLPLMALQAGEPADVRYEQLRVSPADYKNKDVAYEAAFVNVAPNLPKYVAQSGFDPDHYFMLNIGSIHLPVMARRSEDLTAIVSKLKAGDIVRVEGRVREFRDAPERMAGAPYYLDLDQLVFLHHGPAGTPEQPNPQRPIRRKS